MLTVKEFRSQYQLSESQFKRYRAAADERSGSPTCQRQGSNTWIVVNPDAILAEIPESVKNPSVAQETSAITIPTSSIQVLNPDQTNTLDLLAEKYAIKPFKPVQLNGSQETNLDIAQKLALTVDSMKAENARFAQVLADREAKSEAIESVVKGIGKEMRGQFEVNASLQEKAEKVEAKDLEIKKQLAELLKSLQ